MQTENSESSYAKKKTDIDIFITYENGDKTTCNLLEYNMGMVIKQHAIY